MKNKKSSCSAQANPFFIFPVKRDNGYYILISQNQEKSFVRIKK